MNINEVVVLLTALYEFLSARKVEFSVVISRILNDITNAKTNAHKLLLIEKAREQLQGGMGSLNDIWICEDNGHLTDDEKVENKKLEEYRVRLRALLAK